MPVSHAHPVMLAAAALLIAGFARADDGDAGAEQTCTLEEGPGGVVTSVLDGETVKLEGGTEVRLIGALAPRARDADARAGTWEPEREAKEALSRLVVGKHVKLAFGGRRADRYGRALAHLFIVTGVGEEWVQGEMLDLGQARAYGFDGNFACGNELLAHETIARNAKLGLWRNAIYGPKPAERPDYLMRLRGKYERIVGKVESVGLTKAATYLNFGADRHTDFTVRVDKRVLAANPAFALRLKSLQGVHVSVRGWIVRRGGPEIEISDSSEIEVLDEDGPGGALAGAGRVPGQAGATKPASAPAPPSKLPGPEKAHPAPPEGAEPGAVKL